MDSTRSLPFVVAKNETRTSINQEQQNQKGPESDPGSVRVVSGSGFRYVVPFPWRLHQMICETEIAGKKSIVSWTQDSRHFKVHDPQVFMEDIVPRFFKQKSYKSFQRQLHLYGFIRVLKGPIRGAYFHPKFIREHRNLTHEIVRIKPSQVKQTGKQTRCLEQCIKNEADININAIEPSKIASYGPINSSEVIATGRTAQATNMWLIGAGVAFSDLDPDSIDMKALNRIQKDMCESSGSTTLSSSLLECAEEISALFGESSEGKLNLPETLDSLLQTSILHLDDGTQRHQEAFFSNPAVIGSVNPSVPAAFPDNTISSLNDLINNAPTTLPAKNALSNACNPKVDEEYLSIIGQWDETKPSGVASAKDLFE